MNEEDTHYYVAFIYLIFLLLWIILILINNFQKSEAYFILFIPVIIFIIGFFNANNCNFELQKDVISIVSILMFTTSFLSTKIKSPFRIGI